MSVNRAKAVIEAARAEGRDRLSEHEAKLVLEAYGIPITREQVVRTDEELAAALQEFAGPVAIKIDSPDIAHKTEAGLVKLNCRTPEEATAAFAEVLRRAREYAPQARINGVLVQEMVAEATECIVGIKKDELFGPTIAFGLGGIFVEVFEDVSLRVAPLTGRDAATMIAATRGSKVLAGSRGRPRADVAAVEDVLLKMSRLALDLDEHIAEVDVNPLMVGPEGHGAKAADALILLSR